MNEIPEDIRLAAENLVYSSGAQRAALGVLASPFGQEIIARAILAERKRWQREVSDKLYMLQAYREMLGPIGLQVADLWRAKGVQRVHHDWGPDAASMTGEERAKFILGLSAALATPEDAESALAEMAEETKRLGLD